MKKEPHSTNSRKATDESTISLKKIFQYKDALRPLFILFLLLIVSFCIIIFLDKYSIKELLQLMMSPSAGVVADLFANAGGEIVLGLLGIVMTVVAIIVELAANRYTARVSDLFVRDKVNMLFLILLAFTSLNLIVILYITRSDEKIASILINIAVVSMFVCIITLVPYFIYVFKFLEPNSIISKIENDVLKNAKRARRIITNNPSKIRKKNDAFQLHVVQGIDQLTDIVLNSIDKKDKILATNCIKSLSNFSINYIDLKGDGRFNEAWFYPSDYVRYNNADFVTLMDDSFEVILNEKTWVEHKLFRQLHNVFQESVNKARDICNFTAQCFYIIGNQAVKKKDFNVTQLVIKFFNTLLRTTLNAMDVRTCFNLLNQYKLFGLALADLGEEKILIDVANHFKYYGILAKETKKLPFILETAAHDLCDLCKRAYLNKLDKKSKILNIILNVDEPLDGEKEESSLRGIRKAQIILATFFLSAGGNDGIAKARRILDDILDEVDRKNGGYERIYSMIRELKYLKAEFWEIIDRGMNLDYVPIAQKKYLQVFMDWINAREILLYCHLIQKGEKNKAAEIINEFIEVISCLPDEVPVELKEFEPIYGSKGIDTKDNYYKHIVMLLEKLTDKKTIINEIKNYLDIPEAAISEKKIKDYINGVTAFKHEFTG